MITLFKDPFFTNTLDRVFDVPTRYNLPESKIKKLENDYQVVIPVPGLSKDDLKISIKDGTLKIHYEKTEDSLFVDTFTKVYTLPDDIDENKIEGKVENGVLKLIIPLIKKKSLEKLISLN